MITNIFVEYVGVAGSSSSSSYDINSDSFVALNIKVSVRGTQNWLRCEPRSLPDSLFGSPCSLLTLIEELGISRALCGFNVKQLPSPAAQHLSPSLSLSMIVNILYGIRELS